MERCWSLSPIVVRWCHWWPTWDIFNGGVQQGSTCWVQYLDTWDSWHNGISCCRVGGDHFRLLMVRVQAQFRPYTWYNLQVMSNVLPWSRHPGTIHWTLTSAGSRVRVWTGKKGGDRAGLRLAVPLYPEVLLCHAKTVNRARNRKSGQRGAKLYVGKCLPYIEFIKADLDSERNSPQNGMQWSSAVS